MLRVAEHAPALGDETFQVLKEVTHGALAALLLLGCQGGFQGTKDGQRPRAQWAALLPWYVQEIADHLHRHRGGEVANEIASAALVQTIEQTIDQLDHRGFERGDGTWCEGAGDDPAYARMQGRIIEDEAGGVMLVEQAVAIFGSELALFVG